MKLFKQLSNKALLSIVRLVIILIPVIGNAQTWAPIGAKWSFGVGYAFSPRIGNVEWRVIKDTVVNNKNCRISQRFGVDVEGDYTDRMITYEDSNRVYWFTRNQFALMYDFNKVAGESWVLHSNTCTVTVQVTATGVDTINGKPLKTMEIMAGGVMNGKIIQGIGTHPSSFLLHNVGLTKYHLSKSCCKQSKIDQLL